MAGRSRKVRTVDSPLGGVARGEREEEGYGETTTRTRAFGAREDAIFAYVVVALAAPEHAGPDQLTLPTRFACERRPRRHEGF